jgi:hypothetical protein
LVASVGDDWCRILSVNKTGRTKKLKQKLNSDGGEEEKRKRKKFASEKRGKERKERKKKHDF